MTGFNSIAAANEPDSLASADLSSPDTKAQRSRRKWSPEWSKRPVYDRIREVRRLIHDPVTDIGYELLGKQLLCDRQSVANYYHASFAPMETLEALRLGNVAITQAVDEGRRRYKINKENNTLTALEKEALERQRCRAAQQRKLNVQTGGSVPQPAVQLSEAEEIPCLPPISAAPFNQPPVEIATGRFETSDHPTLLDVPSPKTTHLGAESFILPGSHTPKNLRNTALLSLDEINEQWCDMLNWSGRVDPKPAPAPFGQRVKIVSAGDFHVPFQHNELIDRLIREEAADTDILVIPGDFFDGFNFSRFDKPKRETHPAAEFQKGQEIMHRLAAAFRRIKVIPGNHDARVFKAMMKTPDGAEFIELFTSMDASIITPLNRVCSFYDNVEMVPPAKVEYAEFAFLYEIGDLVLGHAEVFSQVPGQAANRFANWLHNFAHGTNVTGTKIRVVGEAHTHQFSCCRGNQSWNIELGSMVRLQGYMGSAKIQSPRPPSRGYCIFVQYDGITNMEEFRHKFDDQFKRDLVAA